MRFGARRGLRDDDAHRRPGALRDPMRKIPAKRKSPPHRHARRNLRLLVSAPPRLRLRREKLHARRASKANSTWSATTARLSPSSKSARARSAKIPRSRLPELSVTPDKQSRARSHRAAFPGRPPHPRLPHPLRRPGHRQCPRANRRWSACTKTPSARNHGIDLNFREAVSRTAITILAQPTSIVAACRTFAVQFKQRGVAVPES